MYRTLSLKKNGGKLNSKGYKDALNTLNVKFKSVLDHFLTDDLFDCVSDMHRKLCPPPKPSFTDFLSSCCVKWSRVNERVNDKHSGVCSMIVSSGIDCVTSDCYYVHNFYRGPANPTVPSSNAIGEIRCSIADWNVNNPGANLFSKYFTSCKSSGLFPAFYLCNLPNTHSCRYTHPEELEISSNGSLWSAYNKAHPNDSFGSSDDDESVDDNRTFTVLEIMKGTSYLEPSDNARKSNTSKSYMKNKATTEDNFDSSEDGPNPLLNYVSAVTNGQNGSGRKKKSNPKILANPDFNIVGGGKIVTATKAKPANFKAKTLPLVNQQYSETGTWSEIDATAIFKPRQIQYFKSPRRKGPVSIINDEFILPDGSTRAAKSLVTSSGTMKDCHPVTPQNPGKPITFVAINSGIRTIHTLAKLDQPQRAQNDYISFRQLVPPGFSDCTAPEGGFTVSSCANDIAINNVSLSVCGGCCASTVDVMATVSRNEKKTTGDMAKDISQAFADNCYKYYPLNQGLGNADSKKRVKRKSYNVLGAESPGSKIVCIDSIDSKAQKMTISSSIHGNDLVTVDEPTVYTFSQFVTKVVGKRVHYFIRHLTNPHLKAFFQFIHHTGTYVNMSGELRSPFTLGFVDKKMPIRKSTTNPHLHLSYNDNNESHQKTIDVSHFCMSNNNSDDTLYAMTMEWSPGPAVFVVTYYSLDYIMARGGRAQESWIYNKGGDALEGFYSLECIPPTCSHAFNGALTLNGMSRITTFGTSNTNSRSLGKGEIVQVIANGSIKVTQGEITTLYKNETMTALTVAKHYVGVTKCDDPVYKIVEHLLKRCSYARDKLFYLDVSDRKVTYEPKPSKMVAKSGGDKIDTNKSGNNNVRFEKDSQ